MAKIATLVDAFSGTSINTSLWSHEAQGTATESGGQLTFSAVNGPADDMYDAINSNSTYDATNSTALMQVIPNTTVTMADTDFGLWDNSLTNGWTMGVVVGGIINGVVSTYVQQWNNNNFTFVNNGGAGIAYDAVNHAWMQISESGGTLTFQTSPTGLSGSWTTIYSTTSEGITGGGVTLSLSAVTMSIAFGYQDNVKRTGSASYANLNVAPSSGGGGPAYGSGLIMMGVV